MAPAALTSSLGPVLGSSFGEAELGSLVVGAAMWHGLQRARTVASELRRAECAAAFRQIIEAHETPPSGRPPWLSASQIALPTSAGGLWASACQRRPAES